jgi:poly(A) polymerase
MGGIMENLLKLTAELKTCMNKLLKVSDLVRSLLDLAFEHGYQLYLVGGLIRDVFSRQSSKDVDFVTSEASELARSLARKTGCRPVLIDQKFGTIRLVPAITPDDGSLSCLIDISPMRGATIEEDLRRRDFTVNAMAVNLSAWQTNGIFELFDPLGGLYDLRAKRLRPCAMDSLADDPLRILRAYRLVCRSGFTLDTQTRSTMADLRFRLENVAVERIRDELVLILGGANSASILRMLDEDFLLGELLPKCEPMRNQRQNNFNHQDCWQHSISALEALESFLLRPQELLGRYGPEATEVLAQRFAGERTRQIMLKVAALLHDVVKPNRRNGNNDGDSHFAGHEVAGASIAGSLCARLRFSNREIEFVSEVVRQHLRPIHLLNQKETCQRALARFFRLGPELFWPLLLLFGSNQMAAPRSQSPSKTIRTLRQHIGGWLDFYYQQLEPRKMEPPLLTGLQLIEFFHLSPGPMVGKLLQRLADLQWEGEISSREEALQQAAQLLEKWTKRRQTTEDR